nr:VIER F-box protein 2 [Tanacetum cinerariifolium]
MIKVEIVGIANVTCDLNRDDDSEQQMSQESDNDMKYDPSDVEFTAWLALKKFNYKTMDHYTKRVLWIYWLRGDDEVELTDKESFNSDHEGEVVGIFRIETNVFDFETPLCRTFKEFNYLLQIDPDVLTKDIKGFKTYEEYKDDWIYEWNKDVPWVHKKPWTNTGVWTEPASVVHCCKPFNYKSGYLEWPTCSWRNNGYRNGGNFPGAYIIGNSLHYLDYEWYKALEDGELKEEALRNKAIMERTLDDDDESSYERQK